MVDAFLGDQIKTPKENSKLGTASIRIPLITWGLCVFLIIIKIIFNAFNGRITLMFALGAAVGSLVGLILGIAGVIQKGHRKTHAILGIAFNLFTFFPFGIMAFIVASYGMNTGF